MIQDKLLKEGAVIVVRTFPHTPAIGVLEVTKIENGIVHFCYTRNDEPHTPRDLSLARSDCEQFIIRGYWTDPDDQLDKPLATQSQLDGLWDEVQPEMRDAVTRATYWLERHNLPQIRQEIHKALDQVIDRRLKEMKGEKG